MVSSISNFTDRLFVLLLQILIGQLLIISLLINFFPNLHLWTILLPIFSVIIFWEAFGMLTYICLRFIELLWTYITYPCIYHFTYNYKQKKEFQK